VILKAATVDATQLDEMIDALFEASKEMSPHSAEYSNTVDQYIKLYKLREEANARTSLSPDALLQVFGSLAGIVALISFEKFGHIVTTKALGFVMKAAR